MVSSTEILDQTLLFLKQTLLCFGGSIAILVLIAFLSTDLIFGICGSILLTQNSLARGLPWSVWENVLAVTILHFVAFFLSILQQAAHSKPKEKKGEEQSSLYRVLVKLYELAVFILFIIHVWSCVIYFNIPEVDKEIFLTIFKPLWTYLSFCVGFFIAICLMIGTIFLGYFVKKSCGE